MAQRTIKILVCDVCDGDEKVETHVVSLDGKTNKELEACGPCWSKVVEVVKVGRTKRGPYKKREDTKKAPAKKTAAAKKAPAKRAASAPVTEEKPTLTSV